MLEHLAHSSWLIPVAKEAYKSRAQIANSWEQAVTQIKGKKIEIAVTGLSAVPGQDSRPRLTALSDVFEAKRPVDGVVHVVANGFAGLRGARDEQTLIHDRRITTSRRRCGSLWTRSAATISIRMPCRLRPGWRISSGRVRSA